MSLLPKIDELREVIRNIVLVYHIDDSVVNVSGFRLVRLDRINSQHGGVCIIQCKIVQELLYTNFEII